MNDSQDLPEALSISTPKFFHLVLADVVFQTKRAGVSSMRTQFITQSDVTDFPATRISQLQNSAAATIMQKMTPKEAEGFKVHDVLFLAITPCGYMMQEDFYGQGQTAEAIVRSENEPVSAPETSKAQNVTPFDRKTT